GKRASSFGAATADGDVVWLCAGEAVVAVRVDDGAELARHDVRARCYGAPAIDGDTIHAATRNGEVIALARELLRDRARVVGAIQRTGSRARSRTPRRW
ncbi:MAG: hypothetical protein K8M05_41775, partial [Deltaproteobacteria bacterium]|nr:hypothetical protein [Kofleriaceae bacterium]